jgi:hypothetical protein
MAYLLKRINGLICKWELSIYHYKNDFFQLNNSIGALYFYIVLTSNDLQTMNLICVLLQ